MVKGVKSGLNPFNVAVDSCKVARLIYIFFVCLLYFRLFVLFQRIAIIRKPHMRCLGKALFLSVAFSGNQILDNFMILDFDPFS